MTSAFALDRAALRRVVAVANGKGGVGKTSTTTHLGGAAAASGRRVLVIDLDPQGNSEDDLGHFNDDLGASLTRAVMLGTEPLILRDVRPGLDVIPGGRNLIELVDHLQSKRARSRRGEDPFAAFGAVIAKVAIGYDLVLLDCPPANNEVMQEAALYVAKYLLIPTRSDASSRKGIGEMAQRFLEAKESTNPYLVLLGVLLFEITSGAHDIERIARAWVNAVLAGQAPVFEATIRHVERNAVDAREAGLLAYELPGARNEKSSTFGLASDYRRMAGEVVQRIVELEAAAA